jgi:HEAT repeat protein
MRNVIIVTGLLGVGLVTALPAQQPERPHGLYAQAEVVKSHALAEKRGLAETSVPAHVLVAHAQAEQTALAALRPHGMLPRLNAATALPPVSWAPQDPADSLWRAARAALNANDAAAAARMYRQIRTESRFTRSEYRAAAFYWEAFARHRIGTVAEMRSAGEILQQLRRTHPRYENMGEVDRLASRIDADLAGRGDASAGQRASASAAQAAATQCPDQEMRIAALEALITMPAESAMPLLAQVMSRRDECNAPLREKAVFLISQKRTPQAEELMLAAVRDPSAKVRQQAVFWLSQVDTDRAVNALEEIVRNPGDDARVLEGAVFALSQHKSARAAQLLRDMVSRSDVPAQSRKAAIFGLSQRRDEETGAYLRSLYPSLTDAALKDAVIFAVSQRRDQASADFMLGIALNEREPLEARKQALFWAAQQRTLPLERLGELYDRMPSREMKEQIIFALSQRREPPAVERLIEIARRERDVELRKQAVFWLGQSRDPRAARFLAELIGG